MLGAIAQFETEIRAERQMEGIHKAKQRGVRFGRQKSLNPDEVAALRQKRKEGKTIKTLMAEFQLSKASIYRCLNQP
jgi:DNA invertase Pin-like site-specific DNA recombinase